MNRTKEKHFFFKAKAHIYKQEGNASGRLGMLFPVVIGVSRA